MKKSRLNALKLER